MATADLSLEELTALARNYPVPTDLPIFFDPDHYTRTPVFKDRHLEIAIICFGKGQTSSVHDHQGSNCVVRLLRGKLLELLFTRDGHQLDLERQHSIQPGDISRLNGTQIHQIANLDENGSVLINFYSPPFQVEAASEPLRGPHWQHLGQTAHSG